jgi:hypothetical protein
MRKFMINMTMSYDFDVSVEANSEEEAKNIFTSTPLENLEQKAFKSFYKKLNSIKLDEHDPRFYEDDGKI